MHDYLIKLRFNRSVGSCDGWTTIEHAQSADMAREQALYKAEILGAAGEWEVLSVARHA